MVARKRRTWGERLYRLFHHLYTALLVFVSLFALLLFYAGSAGIPRPLVLRLEQFLLREYEVELDIRKIRWQFPFTMVAHNVDYFVDTSGSERGAPFISVRRIDIPIHPLDWLHDGWPVSAVTATGGVLQLPAYAGAIRANSPANLMLNGMHGEIGIESNRVLFTRLQGKLNRLDFLVSGHFDVPQERDREKSLYDHWTGLYFAEDAEVPAWLAEITEQLNRTRFSEGVLRARFELHPLVLHSNTVDLQGIGGPTQCRGVELRDWRFRAELNGPLFTLSNAVVNAQDGRIDLLAQRDFSADTVYASLGGGLAFEDLRRLMPQSVNKVLDDWNLGFGPRAALSIKVGPSDVDHVSEHVAGTLALDALHYRGVTEQQVHAAFELEKDMLWITEYTSQVVSTNGNGPCSADGMLYFDNRSFLFNFTTAFYPDALLPACSPALADFIRGFDFHSGAPTFTGRVTGYWDQPGSIRSTGSGAATNFTMDSVPIKELAVDIMVTNDYVALTNLYALREEGALYGSLMLPLSQGEAGFDVTSRVNPKAVADLISPVVSYILDPFEFRGETEVSAYGTVDYSVRTQMNFNVDVSATDMGVYMLDFTQAVFSVMGTGDEYRVTNIDGSLYGGKMVGEMVFFPVEEELYRYNVTASVSQVKFASLLQRFGKHPEDLPREVLAGVLRADMLLSGITGSNWLDSVVARGQVVIDKGCLLQIPLFGPLSRFLSRLIPNLGCLAQTEFQCDYSIEEGVLHIKNGRLYGNVISINLSGDYVIATEGLDIRVQVKLLRDNILAKLVNIVTYPITKVFLEFHLGGTLEEPDWRPVNVPKELYLDFD
jgi:hypothetical protein